MFYWTETMRNFDVFISSIFLTLTDTHNLLWHYKIYPNSFNRTLLRMTLSVLTLVETNLLTHLHSPGYNGKEISWKILRESDVWNLLYHCSEFRSSSVLKLEMLDHSWNPDHFQFYKFQNFREVLTFIFLAIIYKTWYFINLITYFAKNAI